MKYPEKITIEYVKIPIGKRKLWLKVRYGKKGFPIMKNGKITGESL